MFGYLGVAVTDQVDYPVQFVGVCRDRTADSNRYSQYRCRLLEMISDLRMAKTLRVRCLERQRKSETLAVLRPVPVSIPL